MGKALSLDLRKRLVAAVITGGLSCNQAAKQFGVAVSTALGWVRRQRETGSLPPGSQPSPPRAAPGRWRAMTPLAAFGHERLGAPWLREGTIDGASFRIDVERVLRPTRRPGDRVVMDNLGSHRCKIVRQLIRP